MGVEYLYPLSNPVTSLLYGNPKALYTLLCAVTGLLCAVQVVAEFIRTAFSRQRQMIALQSRSQQAQAGIPSECIGLPPRVEKSRSCLVDFDAKAESGRHP